MAATVAERLRAAAKLFEERNAMYGNNYKLFGKVAHQMFPHGLAVHSEDQWTRLIMFCHVITKITRYSANFATGGHSDSLQDLAVYATMMDETDEESNTRANEAWARATFGSEVFDKLPPETPPDISDVGDTDTAPPVTSVMPISVNGEVAMLSPEVQRELEAALERASEEEASFVPRGRTQGVSLDEYRAQNPWADVPRTPLAKDPNERMIPRSLSESEA